MTNRALISSFLDGYASKRTMQMMFLTIAASSAAFSRTALSPLQEAVKLSLGLSDNQIALLQGPAMALPMIVSAIPLGLLIDRRPRVPLLIGLVFFNLIGGAFTAFAHSFGMLFAWRCLVGLTSFAIAPVVLSIIADLYSPESRGRATMAMTIGQFAGASAVFALGGNVLAMLAPGEDRWREAMLATSAPLVLTSLVVLLVRDPGRSNWTGKGRASGSAESIWECRMLFLPLLSGVVTVEVALCAALIWAGPALARNFNLTPAHVGSLMAMVLLLSGILGTLAGGFLVDFAQRTGGARRTLRVLIGLTACSVATGLFSVMPGAFSASIVLLIFVSCTSAICVVGTALSTVVVPASLRGRCLTILFTCGAVFGVGLAPIAVTSLSTMLGGQHWLGTALSLVCVSASCLGVIILLVSRREFDKAVANWSIQ